MCAHITRSHTFSIQREKKVKEETENKEWEKKENWKENNIEKRISWYVFFLSVLLLVVVAMYQSNLIYLFKMWHNGKTNWIHAKSIMYAVSVVGCLKTNKRLDSVDVCLLMIEKANTFLTMSKANDEWKWKKAYPYVRFISLMFMVQRFTRKEWIGKTKKN